MQALGNLWVTSAQPLDKRLNSQPCLFLRSLLMRLKGFLVLFLLDFFTNFLSNQLGACGKSERSLQMIAGGNGEAIGKVSSLLGKVCFKKNCDNIDIIIVTLL